MLELIHLYLEKVQEVLEAFKQKYGEEFAVTEWRSKGIPRVGMFPKYGVSRYGFHGIGLFTKLNGIEVDFDFGPNGETNGFDGWRLFLFARNFPTQFRPFQDSDFVDLTLKSMAQQELVHRAKGSSLYFLR